MHWLKFVVSSLFACFLTGRKGGWGGGGGCDFVIIKPDFGLTNATEVDIIFNKNVLPLSFYFSSENKFHNHRNPGVKIPAVKNQKVFCTTLTNRKPKET